MRGPPDLQMRRAPLPGRPNRKSDFNKPVEITEPTTDIQVRSLRQHFALGYCMAASLGTLIWRVGPR